MSATSHWALPGASLCATGGQPVGCACMTLLRLGQRGLVTAQQIERTVHLGQVLPADVERAGRGIDGAMAEQELDGAQVHPGFQEMRSKAVPQGMDAFAVGDASSALGAVVELLRGGDRDGLGGVFAGKEPRRRAVALPKWRGYVRGKSWTTPWAPSSRMGLPSGIRWVARWTLRTAGMPYSRATMAPWDR